MFTCICLHARLMSVIYFPDSLLWLSNQILLVKIFSNIPKSNYSPASSWRMWEMSWVQNAVGWVQSHWVGCQSRPGKHLVENRLDAKLWPLQVGTVLCLLGSLKNICAPQWCAAAWVDDCLCGQVHICTRDSPIALQHLSAFGQFLDSP